MIRHHLTSIAAVLALAVPATARAQQAPPCTDLPSESVDLGEPTGFRVVVKKPGDVPTDPCHVIRAEKAQALAPIRAWQPGDPAPYGFHPEYQPRLGLVRGGAITAGVAYGLSVVMALATERSGYFAAIPLAGPFIAAATWKPAPKQCNAGFACAGQAVADSLSEVTVKTLMIGAGITQVAGTALIVSGVAARKWTLVPDDDGPRVTPAPMIGQGTMGLGFVGRF